MTFLPRLILAGLAVFCVAGSAFAYTLFPLNTRSRLSGTLEFVNTQHLPHFRCRVSMTLRTRNPHEGISKFSEIVSAKIIFPSKSCPPSVLFNDQLPLGAGTLDATTAVIAFGGWHGSTASCEQTETSFTVDANGVWTASAPSCFIGTLTTTPPITISP